MKQMNALKEVNKMLRKVKSWKKGKRVMVNVESNHSRNYANVRIEGRQAWGNPDGNKKDR